MVVTGVAFFCLFGRKRKKKGNGGTGQRRTETRGRIAKRGRREDDLLPVLV